jgi:hypothetical protein
MAYGIIVAGAFAVDHRTDGFFSGAADGVGGFGGDSERRMADGWMDGWVVVG